MIGAGLYLAIRGGISWPTATRPSYYCVLGLKEEPTLTNKRPLVLLDEGETSLIEKSFEKLTIASTRLLCSRFYADLNEANQGYQNSLYRYVREHKIEGIWLEDASAFYTLERGISLIKQWQHDKALVIPENTILHEHLSSIPLDELKDIEDDFYSIPAFLYVLLSFEAFPYVPPGPETPQDDYDPLTYGLRG